VKLTTLFIVLLGFLATACDNRSAQLAEDAGKCDRALKFGEIELAEKFCQSALGDPGSDVLEPGVESQRLLKLASIKRQRAKYSEADTLVRQSLEIEETLSGPDSMEVGRRLVEFSLILAGEAKWTEGTQVLERLIPLADGLPPDERAVAARTFKSYAVQLRKTDQTELASTFQVKSDALKAGLEAEAAEDKKPE
jgi:hypothetical protein